MNCLDDWCTEVVQFCMAKSKYKDSPLMVCCSTVNDEEENDEVDGGFQEIIPEAEAYIR